MSIYRSNLCKFLRQVYLLSVLCHDLRLASQAAMCTLDAMISGWPPRLLCVHLMTVKSPPTILNRTLV